jgi:acetyl-CoA carboxylase biotin carboxyl carrier protein
MEYDKILQLINDFGNSKLNNIKLNFPDGTKIDMSKNEEQVKVIENTSNREDYEIPKVEKKEEKTAGKIITSPMVGTFYMKPSPNSDPYVKVGQKVKKGDVLCIIEAMKLMNEIEAEFDGEIKEILVKDGESVEYGKPLFKLED